MTADQHLTFCNSLFGQRAEWDARWQRILEWVTPHKAFVTRKDAPNNPPTTLANASRVHDTTGIEACNTLADFMMSRRTPLGTYWMKGMAPREFTDNSGPIDTWYDDCVRRMLGEMEKSNFYTTIYSVYRDTAGPGTGAMYIDRGRNTVMTFTYMEVGTYAVQANETGVIDTITRKFPLTCIQAVEKFMDYREDDPPSYEAIKEKLGQDIAECYKAAMNGDAVRMAEQHIFIHNVKPRLKRDPKRLGAQDMPFESVYLTEKSPKIVEDSGFEDFPFIVSRWELWGNQPYGFSPAYNALPNILTANYLIKLLKAIGEAKAMPRVLELAGQKRKIDLRAGGVTTVSAEEARLNFPKDWAPAGDFELGQWLLEQERQTIRKFFHNDLVKMFSNMEPTVLKDMTAEVARGLKSENLLLLAPSNTQFTSDFRPAVSRMFTICYEAGVFDDIPQELRDATKIGGDSLIPPPTVDYISQVALALKALEDQAADEVFLQMAQAAANIPGWQDLADNFKKDEWIREKSLNYGVNQNLVVPMKDVEKIRAERAAALAEQQAAAMANMNAETAERASKANPANLTNLAEAASAA